MTKSENFIHIKFDYDSAIECKKDILATEIDLLRMNKRLQKYIDSRMQELEIKGELLKKLRSLRMDIGKLQNLMPSIKIPKILRERHETKPLKTEKPVKISAEKSEGEKINEIDAELQEIQRRLDALI